MYVIIYEKKNMEIININEGIGFSGREAEKKMVSSFYYQYYSISLVGY